MRAPSSPLFALFPSSSATTLAFVKSTPRTGVRSFRIVSFAYNHAQSPLLVHPFFPPFPPAVTLPSFHPRTLVVSILSFFSVLPPPSPVLASSLSSSPRVSLSLFSSFVQAHLRRYRFNISMLSLFATFGYLAAFLPSLLKRSVSCSYRRMRIFPRFHLLSPLSSLLARPFSFVRVLPSSEDFLLP